MTASVAITSLPEHWSSSVSAAGEQCGRVRLQIQAFLLCYIVQACGDRIDRDALEAVPLTAGEDRRRDLVQLRRREDEHEVCRWLLKNFQQGVERRVAEHVHLVDDIDALVYVGGGEHRLVAQRTHVFYAVGRCRGRRRIDCTDCR